jgi:hypothetical protein
MKTNGLSTVLSRDAAQAAFALLTPVAVIALVLGMWRFGTDLGWTEDFVISNGLFSHWQIWIALAIALQALASMLSRPEVVRENENPSAE